MGAHSTEVPTRAFMKSDLAPNRPEIPQPDRKVDDNGFPVDDDPRLLLVCTLSVFRDSQRRQHTNADISYSLAKQLDDIIVDMYGIAVD